MLQIYERAHTDTYKKMCAFSCSDESQRQQPTSGKIKSVLREWMRNAVREDDLGDNRSDARHTFDENILQNKINYLRKRKLWSSREKHTHTHTQHPRASRHQGIN